MMFELTARELIAEIFLAGGAFFLLASAIGMLRLPDFYCRLHASGNSETLGIMLSFIGLMMYDDSFGEAAADFPADRFGESDRHAYSEQGGL